MRTIFRLILLLISTNLYSQSLENRSVDYYFQLVENFENDELKKAGILNDSFKVTDKFKDYETGGLNEQGRSLYYDIKVKVLGSIFKDYLYLQSLEYKDDIYVLYFSMAGFDDVEFQILRWRKKNWDMNERISRKLVDSYDTKTEFDKIAFNYDEGPKNLDRVRMFVKGSFLVLERGGLYHTCYDLVKRELIVNEESPWNASDGQDEERMNKWIKTNLHDKIEQIIK